MLCSEMESIKAVRIYLIEIDNTIVLKLDLPFVSKKNQIPFEISGFGNAEPSITHQIQVCFIKSGQ